MNDRIVADGVTPLDADVVPGLSDLTPILQGPTDDGLFRLCLELVQPWNGEIRPLAMPALEIEVETRGLGINRDESIDRWRDYQEEKLKPASEALSRCARERQSR
jgi:hypothetical protein